jgi:hypothetical protein
MGACNSSIRPPKRKSFAFRLGGSIAYSIRHNSYLLSSGVLSEPAEHMRLSKLCLDQFCLSFFNDNLTVDDLEQHVQAGAFAFFEYSLVNWVNHFLAHLKEGEQQNTSASGEPDVGEFIEVLGIFLDVHWVKPKRKARIPSSMMSAVKALPGLEAECRVRLLQTMASSNGFASFELQEPIWFETLKLYSILRKVRLAIENLARDPITRTTLEQFYGDSVFKCPRLYCKWFYEGFDTAAKRDEHVAKHERAYYCSYIGCPHATLGCKTADELETHHQNYHKLFNACDDFPSISSPTGSTPQPNRPPVSTSPAANMPATGASMVNVPTTNISTPSSVVQNVNMPNSAAPKRNQPALKRARPIGPFTCDVCSKVFQRHPHLRSHKRIHTDEKPFACTTCGKTFARPPDLTRHKALHSGEKKFPCGGKLEDGRAWGCGKSFARADGLARHFKGDAGKLCMMVKPGSRPSVHNTVAPSNSIVTTASTNGLQVNTTGTSGLDPHANNSNTTDPGWRVLPSISHLGLNVPQDPYMIPDDDTIPDFVYRQYPALVGLNWDALPPEQP